MFSIIVRSRQKSRFKSIPSPHSSRFISSFFKHNLEPLFTSEQESKAVSTPNLEIKSIAKVVPTFPFYKQYSKSIIPQEILKKSQGDDPLELLSSKKSSYHDGVRNRPGLGSLVEIQLDDGTADLGIVTSTLTGLFYEGSDSLKMVDIKGEEVRFNISQISFHLFKAISPKSLQDLSHYEKNQRIAQLLKHLIKCSYTSRFNDRSLFSMAQAWFAKENSPVEIDLQKISEMIQRYSNQRQDKSLRNEVSLFAAHTQIVNDPINWMAIRKPLGNRNDSLVCFKYYSNSYRTIEHLEKAMKINNAHLKTIADDFKNCIQSGCEIEVKYADSVIALLKHYVLYPHLGLTSPIKEIWKHIKGSTQVTPSDIHQLLLKLGDYDIHETVKPARPNDIYSKINPDHFSFLREPTNQKAYTIPSPDNETNIAVSLEKTRDYWIFEIHVLDIASHVTPGSKLVESLLNRISSFKYDDEKVPLFDDGVFSGFSTNTNDAITISLQYPLDEAVGWNKAELLSINLSKLHNLKMVSIEELNQLNEDKSEFMRLFKHSSNNNLDGDDEDILKSCFKIIEIWTKRRCSQGAISHSLPSKVVEGNESVDHTKIEFVKYLHKELSTIVSEYVIQWSEVKKCPLLIHSQSLLPSLQDKIEIDPQRFSIPPFKASSYEHFTLFSNDQGDVSLKSLVCGEKYLNKEIVTTQASPHVSLGLPFGFVELINPLNDYEAIVNQWQVINILKQEFKYKQGFNYKLNNALQDFKLLSDKQLQQHYGFNIAPLKNFNISLQTSNERFNKLKWLSTKKDDWLIFKCMITKPSTFPNLAKAYCFELDLDVEILLNPSLKQVQIGDQLICTKIVKLDMYIESRLILEI